MERWGEVLTKTGTGKKTVPVKRHRGEPGHTRDTRARGHTDHTDEPHNHPKFQTHQPTAVGRGPVSQSVSYFTVPPRAHPSTGSQSGSATPGRTQVPSTRSRGLLNCRK